MRAVLMYSTLRVVIFGAAVGVFYLAGLRTLWLLIAAAAASALASLLLLKRQRSAMSQSLVQANARLHARLKHAAAKEDHDDQQANQPAQLPAEEQPERKQQSPHQLGAAGGSQAR